MDEKQQFLALLKVAKRKLLIKQLFRNSHLALFILGLTMALFVMLARLVVITHLVNKLIFLAVLILIGIVIVTIIKRPTNKQAAHHFDDFIAENHVITALHYMEDNSLMSHLQRRYAVSLMKKAMIKVQTDKSKKIYWKPLSAFILLVGITSVLFFLPNEMMKLATEQEKEQELIEETKQEIEKLAKEDKTEKLKDLAEETKELKESKELLEELLKQEEKLDKDKQIAEENKEKLNELASEVKGLEEIVSALEDGDSNKLSKALENLANKQPENLSTEEKEGLENLLGKMLIESTPNLSELSDEQLADMMAVLEDQLNELMQSTASLDDLLSLQQQLQNLATSLQQGMFNNGLSNSSELAFGEENQSAQQNQNGNSSNSGENNSNNGQGQNPSPGSGQGNGNGEGNGSGNGSGASGNGDGGSGSGAGFGQGSRELTIPEFMDGKENVESDYGEFGKGDSEFQSTPDGLVMKGSVRSYEEVYGKYEDSYRKSVERLELPTYLENVVKDYFSDLDPEGE
ncbi:hypothetical protein [Paucisalibacillus globulus]|uniref:hypothetical protein n=1 Tax=Paucisalibacillus globulus TaxID=351095 RepID=UPI000411FBD7|nr:hypothetical protein [Paucisalibacillus globulus]